jgi:hypothetical protein
VEELRLVVTQVGQSYGAGAGDVSEGKGTAKGREEAMLSVNFDQGVEGGNGLRWKARRKGWLGRGNKNEFRSREGSRNIDV